MLGHAIILLLIAAQYFALALPHAAKQDIIARLRMHLGLDHEIVLAVLDVRRIFIPEVTLAQRDVMHGIQQIGLAYPVGSHKTIHLRAQWQIRLLMIPEMEQFEPRDVEAHAKHQRYTMAAGGGAGKGK